MEKILIKKVLYFLRYSISKFRDFSGIFFEFLGTFQFFFSIFTKMPPQFFKVKIYRNANRTFKVKIYRNAPPIYKNL